MKNIIWYFLIFVIFSGCSSSDIEHKEGFGSYDLSPDGKSIVFSWVLNGKSYIYVSDIEGTNIQTIFSSKTSTSFLNPKYSNDGKTIVFISNAFNSLGSAVCIGDLNSRKIEKLTDTTRINTEAIFSADDKNVFFCSANEYGNHSILAAKAAHNFDIYSIMRSSKECVRETKLNAYSLSNLAANSGSMVAFHIYAGNDGGMFQYDTLLKRLPRKIQSENGKLDNPNIYSNPTYFDSNKLFFTAYNKLLLMDLDTKQEKVIFLSNFNIANVRYSHSLKRLFFTEENSDGTIYSIDIFGKGMKEIHLGV
ncbi:PD40 domain-containing protein [Pedobacter sp. BMA]|uniref:TolB family protein n=1 Tax=Pedobacter sp. BMA TaxID=1663685 RepID=UPI00064B62F6|nr:PD40 domain-containing protein [Pedobacter sp. BMA]KLT65388.1 hypothetical protein AB669_09860 [Pedobacter sp. BMA]